ncbi:ABC transporter permease [Chitinophaga sp. NPDC101104]|uniref:ABC transporter permease n=1 Tax=Chitinophaga sp. NPDC101104 TaxID=3390561 RepID=UPI003D08E74B
MTELLKIEWLKVKAYRTFWLLSGLFLVIVPLILWSYELILKNNSQMATFLGAFSFPKAWETTAWIGSMMYPIMGILLIIFLTNENNFRTSRQNIIDGWSRDQYILAKFGVMITMALFMTLVITACAVFFGLRSGNGSPGDGMGMIWLIFVQSMDYLALAMFLGVFMRRAGVAIAIYVMYAYVFEFFISRLVDFKVRAHLGALFPLECTDRMIPGETKLVNQLASQGIQPFEQSTLQLIAIGYILLFGFLAYRRIKRSDL